MRKWILLMLLCMFPSVFATQYSVTDSFGGCLGACFQFVNGTSDSCLIDSPGVYDLSGCTVNVSGLNVSGFVGDELREHDPDVNYPFGFVGEWNGGDGEDGNLSHIFTFSNSTKDFLNSSDSVDFGSLVMGVGGNAYYCDDSCWVNSTIVSVVEGNVWVDGLATWNERSSGNAWLGSAGANSPVVDFLNVTDYSVKFNRSVSSVSFDIPDGWFLGLLNGSSAGLLNIMTANSEIAHEQWVSYSVVVNLTNFTSSEYDAYYFSGSAIVVGSDNVSFDCENKTFIGGTGGNFLFSDSRSNVSFFNCHTQNFDSVINLNSVVNVSFYNFSAINTVLQIFGDNITGEGVSISGLHSNGMGLTGVNYGRFVDWVITANGTGARQVIIDNSDNSVFGNWTIVKENDAEADCLIINGNSNYNIFENFTINCKNSDGVDFDAVPSYNNFSNFVISDSLRGFNAFDSWGYNVFSDVVLRNMSSECFMIDSNSNVLDNLTFDGCGQSTQTSQFLSSLSPLSFNGSDFSVGVYFFNSALNTFFVVTGDDFDTSSIVTGSNNFRVWLIDLPGVGISMSTLFVEETPGLDCNAVAGIYGGTCYFDESFWVSDGLADYSVVSGSNASVVSGFTSPPYLRYGVNDVQLVFPLVVNGTGNNVSDSVFLNGTNSTVYESVEVGGNDNLFWNNYFLYGFPSVVGTGNNFCVNNLGNFYEESLTPDSTDCGQINLSALVSGRSVIVNSTNQSGSLISVFYDFFTSRDNNAWAWLRNQSEVNFSEDLSSSTGSYRVKVVPFLWYDGVRFNGSVNVTSPFVILPFGSGGGSSPAVCYGSLIWDGVACVMPGSINVSVVEESKPGAGLIVDFDGLRGVYDRKDNSLIGVRVLTSMVSGGNNIPVSPDNLSVVFFDSSANDTIEIIFPFREGDGIFSFSRSTLNLNQGEYEFRAVAYLNGTLFSKNASFEVTDNFLLFKRFDVIKNIYLVLIAGSIIIIIIILFLWLVFKHKSPKKRKV